MRIKREDSSGELDEKVLALFRVGLKRFGSIAIANAAGTISYQSVTNVIRRGRGHRGTVEGIQLGLTRLCQKDEEFKGQMASLAKMIAETATDNQTV